jgi:hypothetical protein
MCSAPGNRDCGCVAVANTKNYHSRVHLQTQHGSPLPLMLRIRFHGNKYLKLSHHFPVDPNRVFLGWLSIHVHDTAEYSRSLAIPISFRRTQETDRS